MAKCSDEHRASSLEGQVSPKRPILLSTGKHTGFNASSYHHPWLASALVVSSSATFMSSPQGQMTMVSGSIAVTASGDMIPEGSAFPGVSEPASWLYM